MSPLFNKPTRFCTSTPYINGSTRPSGGKIFSPICCFHTSSRNTFSLYTDASGIGWCSYYMPVPFSWPAKTPSTSFDINLFEMERLTSPYTPVELGLLLKKDLMLISKETFDSRGR
jgi:hypothetical protein